MIKFSLRRTALAAAAVAALSFPAAANDDTALSAALGTIQARLAATTWLKPLPQAPALVRVTAAGGERLNLICEDDAGGSAGFLVDFDRQTVSAYPASSCTWDLGDRKLVVPDCNPPGRAVISETSISWETTTKVVSGTGVVTIDTVTGSINRLTGVLVWTENHPNGMRRGQFIGKCRRAAQKF